MSGTELRQTEADALLGLAKIKVDDAQWRYPGVAGKIAVPLVSQDKRENFLLDIKRGRIKLIKGKYQVRARNVIILARLDFGGPFHRNPDGQDIPCPHLHLYREGHGLGWAIPVPLQSFPDIDDRWKTLHDFMRFCNVVDPPRIIKGLYV